MKDILNDKEQLFSDIIKYIDDLYNNKDLFPENYININNDIFCFDNDFINEIDYEKALCLLSCVSNKIRDILIGKKYYLFFNFDLNIFSGDYVTLDHKNIKFLSDLSFKDLNSSSRKLFDNIINSFVGDSNLYVLKEYQINNINDVEFYVENSLFLTFKMLKNNHLFAILFINDINVCIYEKEKDVIIHLLSIVNMLSNYIFQYFYCDNLKKKLEEWEKNFEKKVEEQTQKINEVYHKLVNNEKLEAISQLIATVNHEINNPLAVINGNTQLLRYMLTGKVDDNILAKFDAIENAVKKVHEISSKLSRLTEIKIKDYVDNIKMLDLSDENK